MSSALFVRDSGLTGGPVVYILAPHTPVIGAAGFMIELAKGGLQPSTCLMPNRTEICTQITNLASS